MKKLIGFIGSFFGAVMHILRNGLTSPNEDVDTRLDHHPVPPQSELDEAREKYNFSGA